LKSNIYLILTSLLLLLSSVSIAQRGQVQGKILNERSAQPVEDAIVQILPVGAVQISAKDGTFSFKNLNRGKYSLHISRMGFISDIIPVSLGDSLLIIRLKERAFDLLEVSVVAKEQRIGSSSVIEKSAMIHVQPTSLGDVLQLIPGQLAVNPNLVNAQQINLRQVPSTTDAARANALGTAIVQDGVPVSNNANLQTDLTILNSAAGSLPPFSSVAGRGMDLRQIGADNIESIEVIRGIPSARYGDLTSGLVIVNSRIGTFRPEMRVRLNPNLAQAALMSGFKLGEKGGILNASVDILRSQADPRSVLDLYTRLNGQLAWRKAWDAEKRFVTTSIASGYLTLDELKRDPDDLRYQRIRRANDRGFKLSTEGKWQTGKAWLHSLKYLAAATYSVQDAFYQELITRDLFPVTNATTDTTQVARFGESEYLNQTTVSGRPLNVYANLEANWVLPAAKSFLGISHNLAVGLEYRLDVNFGDGRIFDPTRPPRQNYSVGDRPRSFRAIPALPQLTYYAEDRISGTFANRNFILQMGFRFDNVAPVSVFKSKYGTIPAPRLNLAVEILSNTWLRAGYGTTAKSPTLNFLYPGQRFFDLVNFNYFAVNAAERLVVMTTRVVNLDDQPLKPYRSDKVELGLDFKQKQVSGSVTVFQEKTTGAFGFNRVVTPYAVPKYGILSAPVGKPPVLNPVPVRVDTFFAGYDIPVNNRTYQNRGVEFTFDVAEWKAIRTSFNLTGAFIRTVSFDDGAFIDADRAIFSNNTPNRVPVYQSGVRQRAERFNTSLRFIHHVPKLGLVVSALWQTIWLDRSAAEPLSGLPLGYLNRQGTFIAITPEQAQSPEFVGLQRPVSSTTGLLVTPPPLHLFNFRVTKEWKRGYGFSFYANNLMGSRPLYLNPRSQSFVRRNEPLFFGAEFNVTL
jgi:hypothetical protein